MKNKNAMMNRMSS